MLKKVRIGRCKSDQYVSLGVCWNNSNHIRPYRIATILYSKWQLCTISVPFFYELYASLLLKGDKKPETAGVVVFPYHDHHEQALQTLF